MGKRKAVRDLERMGLEVGKEVGPQMRNYEKGQELLEVIRQGGLPEPLAVSQRDPLTGEPTLVGYAYPEQKVMLLLDEPREP